MLSCLQVAWTGIPFLALLKNEMRPRRQIEMGTRRGMSPAGWNDQPMGWMPNDSETSSERPDVQRTAGVGPIRPTLVDSTAGCWKPYVPFAVFVSHSLSPP